MSVREFAQPGKNVEKEIELFWDGKSIGYIDIYSTFRFNDDQSIISDLEKEGKSKDEQIAKLKNQLQEASQSHASETNRMSQ